MTGYKKAGRIGLATGVFTMDPAHAFAVTAAKELQAPGGSGAVFDAKHRTERTTGVRTVWTDLGVGRRDEKDRRAGTPITAQLLGDPHPDRLAIAEARREAIRAAESKFKLEEPDTSGKGQPELGRAKPSKSRTPDIPEPLGGYIPVPEHLAGIEARREDTVLYFLTARDAARCITGLAEKRQIAAVNNAALGLVQRAWGWEFIRLRSNRGYNARVRQDRA